MCRPQEHQNQSSVYADRRYRHYRIRLSEDSAKRANLVDRESEPRAEPGRAAPDCRQEPAICAVKGPRSELRGTIRALCSEPEAPARATRSVLGVRPERSPALWSNSGSTRAGSATHCGRAGLLLCARAGSATFAALDAQAGRRRVRGCCRVGEPSTDLPPATSDRPIYEIHQAAKHRGGAIARLLETKQPSMVPMPRPRATRIIFSASRMPPHLVNLIFTPST